jgi:hypothetical protein
VVNILERYLSAYVVECSTGIPGEQPENVYDVISNSRSNTTHPLLSQVAELVRQHRPELPSTKQEVKAMLAAFLEASPVSEEAELDELLKLFTPQESEFRGEYRRLRDMIMGIVMKGDVFVAAFSCHENQMPKAVAELQKTFKGISIFEV